MKTKQLPDGWKEVELGKIAEFVNGRAFKPAEWESKGKLIIRIQDLTGSVEKPNRTTKIFEGKYLVKKGDLLISWSATLDAFIWNKEEGWLNQHIFKVVEDKKVVDHKYLFYFVKKSISLFLRETHGSTMKHITKGRFEAIKIPLPFLNGKPDLSAQKKIVATLERAEALKKKRAEADALTDEYLKSVFNEMFVGKGFEEVELGKHIVSHDSKRVPLKESDREKRDGTYPYYGASGIIDYIDDYLFDFESILIGEDGANLISRSTPIAFSVKGKYWVNNHAHVLTTKKSLGKTFLLFYINSIDLKSYLSGSAQPKLTAKNLNSIKLILPPLTLQQKFASIVEKVEKMKEKQKQSKESIDEMFNVLMQRAFRGELVQ